MLVGYVSDENYAALTDVQLEFEGGNARPVVARSAASGAVYADLTPGEYEICLARPGFGSKGVRHGVRANKPIQFRLLSYRLFGPAYTQWLSDGCLVYLRC